MSDVERGPPANTYNLTVEIGFLGALFLNNDHLGGIHHWLDAEDFYEPIHADIYDLCVSAFKDQRVANHETLKPHFEGYNFPDGTSLQGYVGGMIRGACAGLSVYSYGRTIKELSRRRALWEMSSWLGDAIAQPGSDMDAVGTDLQSGLDDWLDRGRIGRKTRFDAEEMAVEALTAESEADAVPTQLVDLDRKIGGYRRGEFTIIGARPSMGKTMFATSTGIRMAIAGRGVAYFSLEMKAKAVGQRCLSDLSWNQSAPIPYVEILRGSIIEYERHKLEDTAKKLIGIPWMIDDRTGLTVGAIAARARAYRRELESDGKRLDLVMIDHLNKVKPSQNRNGNLVQETKDVIEDLTLMAKDLDVAVIALCQLSRAVEGRDEKRPVLSDLKWSGAGEEDADCVMFLFRRAYYYERTAHDDAEREEQRQATLESCKHELECIVAKQRNGPLGPVSLFTDIKCNVVRDAATGY